MQASSAPKFAFPNNITRGMQASAARRKSLSHLHPESYRQLCALVKLHGVIELRQALDEMEILKPSLGD